MNAGRTAPAGGDSSHPPQPSLTYWKSSGSLPRQLLNHRNGGTVCMERRSQEEHKLSELRAKHRNSNCTVAGILHDLPKCLSVAGSLQPQEYFESLRIRRTLHGNQDHSGSAAEKAGHVTNV